MQVMENTRNGKHKEWKERSTCIVGMENTYGGVDELIK